MKIWNSGVELLEKIVDPNEFGAGLPFFIRLPLRVVQYGFGFMVMSFFLFGMAVFGPFICIGVFLRFCFHELKGDSK
jgi:hypothetical protein